MKHSKRGLFVELSITTLCHYAECRCFIYCNAVCRGTAIYAELIIR